jgi:hypothetical protein
MCFRLEPLLQTWQHFVGTLVIYYAISCGWCSYLAFRWSRSVDRLLVPASRLDSKFLAGAIAGWFSLFSSFGLCGLLYFCGRAFLAHSLLFLVCLALVIAYLVLLGSGAHNLAPDARRAIHAAFLELIGPPDRPRAIVDWMASHGCNTAATCTEPVTAYLKMNVASFWTTATFLGVILAAFVGIGIIILLMVCVPREPLSSDGGPSDLELTAGGECFT